MPHDQQQEYYQEDFEGQEGDEEEEYGYEEEEGERSSGALKLEELKQSLKQRHH